MPTPTHYYIWFRVTGDVQQARAAVATLVADLQERTGVVGRLLQGRHDPRTWMEIYENVNDAGAFERELETAAARHDVARFAENGTRNVEAFESQLSPAKVT